MGLHGREAFPRKISMQGHKNPMTFLFLHHEISKGGALYLIAEKKREAFPGSLCTIFHETNYPQSKIFQSSNLPIFRRVVCLMEDCAAQQNLPEDFHNLPRGSLMLCG
jgi:hypothetical protein